jgi:hypothetical protein
VIAELEGSADRQVGFFYFKKDDLLRDSHIAMLKGLLAQVIRISSELLPYVYEEVSASLERVLGSPKTLMMLLETAFGAIEQLWMVLDGLDECGKKERKKILSWILKITSEGHLFASRFSSPAKTKWTYNRPYRRFQDVRLYPFKNPATKMTFELTFHERRPNGSNGSICQ